MRFSVALALVFHLAMGGTSFAAARAEASQEASTGDVIARVGDQSITFNQVNTMLNSSAVVGVSIPAIGTPERDTARIVVLDKVISANLLYLDALKQGLDRDPGYRREVKGFSDGILAALYLQHHLAGDIPVSDEEIQTFFKETLQPGTELTDALRIQIEATLRKRKLQERLAAERKHLREGVDVTLYQGNFKAEGDDERADALPVAEVGGEVISWGEVKAELMAAGVGAQQRDPLAMELDARMNALQAELDTRIMAKKAREAGLERDPLFQARLNEFKKTRLINLHRANLAREMDPSDEELKAHFDKNRDRIVLREMRKVQEVVVGGKQEGEALKTRLETGELTLFQAAAEYSIAPGAKQHLGEIGWVTQGRAQPALDEVIFALGPDEIGGPVQSTEGWHLLRVLDVREAQYADLDDEATRKHVRRRYIHERLDGYVADLRKDRFEVQVYEDVLVSLAQREADMVKQLAEKAGESDSMTKQRVRELQEMLKPDGG
ncbi:MAG: peptidyl-prolyl cis-trans isomerase [Gammaproteobacteria bacterium]|jgi:parvulin-like peptidyl-prolyl isomerase